MRVLSVIIFHEMYCARRQHTNRKLNKQNILHMNLTTVRQSMMLNHIKG